MGPILGAEDMGSTLSKIKHLFKETFCLVREHQLYFLAPLLLLLAILSFLFFHVDSGGIVSFIYGGL